MEMKYAKDGEKRRKKEESSGRIPQDTMDCGMATREGVHKKSTKLRV